MFIPKNAVGEYDLDPQEPEISEWERERATKYLDTWNAMPWKPGQEQKSCPHGDSPCVSRDECIDKIAWWRRYIREIEIEGQ